MVVAGLLDKRRGEYSRRATDGVRGSKKGVAARCGAGWSAVMSTKLLQAKRRSGVVRREGHQAWKCRFNNAQGHVLGVLQSRARGETRVKEIGQSLHCRCI